MYRAAFLILTLITCLVADGALAGSHLKPVYFKKIYNPETKSYFEMVDLTKIPGAHFRHIRWRHARLAASKRTFKGVRGRLASVKTKQAHTFLISNFRPNRPIWIGLRYWCIDKKLRWVNGDEHPRQAFAPWHRVWNHFGAWHGEAKARPYVLGNCAFATRRNLYHYMGVHYWGPPVGNVWNANGPEKGFKGAFIEYLTGKP